MNGKSKKLFRSTKVKITRKFEDIHLKIESL